MIDFESTEFLTSEVHEAVKNSSGSPGASQCAQSSIRIPRHLLPSESDDDFAGVVVLLDFTTRVIACSDGIQWAIQKCGKAERRLWRSIYYFRTKAGLLFYARSYAPELLALPDRFPERGGK